MEIRQLRALAAIADAGSFWEAADMLGLTQSALSHQLRQLEQELGETLLVRARPRAYPTPAGRVVLEAASRIDHEIRSLEQRFVQSRHGAVVGTLRIAATPMSFTHLLGDLCESFRRQFPQVELVFTATESAEQAVRRVLTGASDMAFGPLTGQHDSLHEVRLASVEHAFIVRAGHPLAESGRVTTGQRAVHVDDRIGHDGRRVVVSHRSASTRLGRARLAVGRWSRIIRTTQFDSDA